MIGTEKLVNGIVRPSPLAWLEPKRLPGLATANRTIRATACGLQASSGTARRMRPRFLVTGNPCLSNMLRAAAGMELRRSRTCREIWTWMMRAAYDTTGRDGERRRGSDRRIGSGRRIMLTRRRAHVPVTSECRKGQRRILAYRRSQWDRRRIPLQMSHERSRGPAAPENPSGGSLTRAGCECRRRSEAVA